MSNISEEYVKGLLERIRVLEEENAILKGSEIEEKQEDIVSDDIIFNEVEIRHQIVMMSTFETVDKVVYKIFSNSLDAANYIKILRSDLKTDVKTISKSITDNINGNHSKATFNYHGYYFIKLNELIGYNGLFNESHVHTQKSYKLKNTVIGPFIKALADYLLHNKIPVSKSNTGKTLFKFNKDKKLIKVYDSLTDAASKEKCDKRKFNNYIKDNVLYNDHYWSFSEVI